MRSTTIELGLVLINILGLKASPQTLKTFDTASVDIKNGKVSEDGFPGIVSLQDSKGQAFCGGALISPNLVMTAAHCVLTHKVNTIYAQIGEKSLDKAKLSDRIVGEKIHFPPEFQALMTYKREILDINYDIALIRLVKNSTKEIMKLNTDKDPIKKDEEATAIGWGRLNGLTMNPSPRNLNQVQMKLTDSKTCAKVFDNFSATDSYCFTSPNNNTGASTCMGDSGSPLMLQGAALAVVSAGSVNCNDGLAIFTKVSTHLDWIKDFMNNKSPKELPIRVIPL